VWLLPLAPTGTGRRGGDAGARHVPVTALPPRTRPARKPLRGKLFERVRDTGRVSLRARPCCNPPRQNATVGRPMKPNPESHDPTNDRPRRSPWNPGRRKTLPRNPCHVSLAPPIGPRP